MNAREKAIEALEPTSLQLAVKKDLESIFTGDPSYSKFLGATIGIIGKHQAALRSEEAHPKDPDAHIEDQEAYLRAKQERFALSEWEEGETPDFTKLATDWLRTQAIEPTTTLTMTGEHVATYLAGYHIHIGRFLPDPPRDVMGGALTELLGAGEAMEKDLEQLQYISFHVGDGSHAERMDILARKCGNHIGDWRHHQGQDPRNLQHQGMMDTAIEKIEQALQVRGTVEVVSSEYLGEGVTRTMVKVGGVLLKRISHEYLPASWHDAHGTVSEVQDLGPEASVKLEVIYQERMAGQVTIIEDGSRNHKWK